MFSMKTLKSQSLKMLISSTTALTLLNSGGVLAQNEGMVNGDNPSPRVGKLAESCILISQGMNLRQLERQALNLPDGMVWIEWNNGRYLLKAKLTEDQVNLYRQRFGNLTYISCETSYENWVAKREKITLKDMGYSDDVFIEGNGPYFEVNFPLYKTFDMGKFFARFSVSPLANDRSHVALRVNDKIERIFKVENGINAFSVNLPIEKTDNKRFLRIALDGYLRITENICEDLNTKGLYLRVDVNRSGFYVIRNLELKTIKNFFEDYAKNYYLMDLNEDAIKLAYYIPASIRWLKVNVLPLEDNPILGEKVIYKNTEGKINLGKNNLTEILYLGNADIISPLGINLLLTSSALNINVNERVEERRNIKEISLRDLGVITRTVNGVGVLSLYIPFDTAKVGGIPEKLHLVLKVATSAPYKHDKVNLELFVNGGLIKSYSIRKEVEGLREYDIEIPSSLIHAGINHIHVKLNYYPASENCLGAVPKVNLSLFDDSYFYWNVAKKEVNTIRDFVNIVNGKVAVIIDDRDYYPYALRLLNVIGQLNDSIAKIDILNSVEKIGDNSKYDYLIIFSKNPKNLLEKVDAPLKIDERGFKVVDIQRDKVLFSFTPKDNIGVIEVFEYKNKPTLLVTAINDEKALEGLYNFDYSNINLLLGNVALIQPEDFSTFTIGKDLKVHYISEKGIEYYWNNYKVFIITALAILLILLEIFIFKNLVRNKKNNKDIEQ